MKQFKAKESLVKGGEDERLGKELKELILRRPQPKWYLQPWKESMCVLQTPRKDGNGKSVMKFHNYYNDSIKIVV